jgi:hypothetical protein
VQVTAYLRQSTEKSCREEVQPVLLLSQLHKRVPVHTSTR